jgi:hypothetical protein
VSSAQFVCSGDASRAIIVALKRHVVAKNRAADEIVPFLRVRLRARRREKAPRRLSPM